MSNPVLEVAVANTGFAWLDYLPPIAQPLSNDTVVVGRRVRVSVRQRELIGVVINVKATSEFAKLKPVIEWVDEQPLLPEALLRFYRWLSDYYHYPFSEVIDMALPNGLRQGLPAALTPITLWQLSENKRTVDPNQVFKRAPKQLALITYLQQHAPVSSTQLASQGWRRSLLASLAHKGWLETIEQLPPTAEASAQTQQADLPLNDQQQIVFDAITKQLTDYHCHLLHGVTGSGKTEVYIQLARRVLQAGHQVLILVPEIGLTPQLVSRFSQRFCEPWVTLHSGLSDQQRLQAWLQAWQGSARIVIGTRSALFTPLPQLGLIIVDEEHDVSFKQQDRLRYSARDGAIVRAQQCDIPILLGSATPSLESLANVARDRFQLHRLTTRAGNAKPVNYQLIDIRRQPLEDGLSKPLLTAMQQRLDAGQQVLLFINRRGYAPVFLCHACGWIADCHQCDAHLTVHLNPDYLQCHHCGYRRALFPSCPSCQGVDFISKGVGTKRLEQRLMELFPQYPVIRIDRDNVRRQQTMRTLMQQIMQGDPQILLGTQMLAKGHHFPQVTLVGVIDADHGLFSTDFRGQERLAQLLLQVAGRAGRAQHAGDVLIQTHAPEHALLQTLISQPYDVLAKTLLTERQHALLPPFATLALLRCDAKTLPQAMTHLTQVKQRLNHRENPQLAVLGPIPAPMQKRAGFFRAQLLLSSVSRQVLQQALTNLSQQKDCLIMRPHLKCTLDVDPLELF
ncbi:MAG: primosomal protein N' [Legionellales bacterium]|nr:primosomal protein N' [Legionellales bacterium]